MISANENINDSITILDDKRLFLNHGPVQMVLDISEKGKRNIDLEYEVGNYLLTEFYETLPFINLLKKNSNIPNKDLPLAVKKMLESTKKLGVSELTPLAAVAGSFSEIALEKALELGGKKVIINNGGDIAFKNLESEEIRLGIPLKKTNDKTNLILSLKNSQGINGVCTSGLGGRSFTKGIADLVVILGESASLADACATYIGNKTNIEDPNIIRCKAEEIDSETDIQGQLVTMKIGELTKKSVYSALLNGLVSAEDLYEKNIIKGAVLSVKNEIVVLPDNLHIEKKEAK